LKKQTDVVSAEGDVDKLLLVIIVGDLGTMLPKPILAKDIQANDLIICSLPAYNVKYISGGAGQIECWTAWYYRDGKLAALQQKENNLNRLSLMEANKLCELVHLETRYKYEVRPIDDQGLMELLLVKEIEEADDNIIIVYGSIISEKITHPTKKNMLKSDQKVFLIERQG
jgi:hypothetical protein